jgi:DNA (cytosine-5)-methyltransferase 1
MLTIGSLFSGIGGLELGLEVAGVGKTIWQVEQDDFCRNVLAKHWPEAERFDDIKTVGANNLGYADIICGGFPCQDISLAGSGAGLAGERSGLWGEMHRVIREIRPRFVIVENVPALTSRGLGTVLGDLASCGYDAQWDCISAASIGACHRRDRLFIIAYNTDPNCGRREVKREQEHGKQQSQRRNESDGLGKTRRREGAHDSANPEREPVRDKSKRDTSRRVNVQAGRQAQSVDDGKERDLTNPQREGLQEREGAQREWTYASIAGGHGGNVEPRFCPVIPNGFPGRVARLKALGNAVVPAVAYQVGRALLQRINEANCT